MHGQLKELFYALLSRCGWLTGVLFVNNVSEWKWLEQQVHWMNVNNILFQNVLIGAHWGMDFAEIESYITAYKGGDKQIFYMCKAPHMIFIDYNKRWSEDNKYEYNDDPL